MGVDIHMFIVKNSNVIKENIFDGRNSEWFNKLRGQGDEYEYLKMGYGMCPYAPKTESFNEESLSKLGYYDFRYFKVIDYINWFRQRRPDTFAGWVTTYTKWQYENKGIVPDRYDVIQTIWKNEEISEKDLHFVEFVDGYDCSRWLYNYVTDKENNIDIDAYVTFWFDC